MPRQMIFRLGLSVCCSALLGCSLEDGEGTRTRAPRTVAFEDLFALERTVQLEETERALITAVEDLALAGDGRLVIPDRLESQVRVYEADGTLYRNLGTFGEGPGQFERPSKVAVSGSDYIFVAEAAKPRITRYRPDLQLDTLFRVDALLAAPLEPVPGGLLIGQVRGLGSAGQDFIGFYDLDGVQHYSFHRPNPLMFDVPYWYSTAGARYRLASNGKDVVVGNALLYPLARYTIAGRFVDSIGKPPPSWVAAPQPERGAFSGSNQLPRFEQWLKTFTIIDRITFYQDSLLLISHQKLNPEVKEYREASYRLDVYTRDGKKMWEDVSIPGRLLHAESEAYLLIDSAPGPWVIGVYSLKSVK